MIAGSQVRIQLDPSVVFVASEPELLHALATAEAVLGKSDPRSEVCDRALVSIAAILYRNSSLASTVTIDRLAAFMRSGKLPERTCRAAGQIFRRLITTAAGASACRSLIGVMSVKNLRPFIYNETIACLRYAAEWVPERLGLDAMIALLGADHLNNYRTVLAETIIERCLYNAGSALSLPTFDCFARQCAESPFFKNICFNLASRHDTSQAVRERASAHTSGRYALRHQIQQVLGGRSSVLVVQNIHDGQGDEIVRGVPLMQALLDFNPELEITVITSRTYLYSHPRIECEPIRDRERVRKVLNARFDAIVDFFEPNIIGFNADPDVEPMVKSYIERRRPPLFLYSIKGYNHLVYQRFDLNSRDMAASLGLDRQRVENRYETTFRLIAEMGLPLRCGESRPVSEPVLAGCPSRETETIWERLTANNNKQRPVAIVSAFGGVERLKGYVEAVIGSLVLELQRLIEEGFYLVLLPNGKPWGSPELLRKAAGRLSPVDQDQVAIGPDPARSPGPGGLPEPDYTMRLLLYFIEYADLVVSVEGWAAHVAYCLGKPYRILMLPHSHDAAWQPYCTTRNQRVIADVRECAGEPDAPPLACQPQKFTLAFVLRELAAAGSREPLPILRRALASEDRDTRLAAAEGLTKMRSGLTPEQWADLLDDRSFRVRGIAARVLRDFPSATLRRIPLKRQALHAYVRIAEVRRNWMAVLALGDAARPALEAGLDDEDDVIARESVQLLRLLDLKSKMAPRNAGVGGRLLQLIRRRESPEASRGIEAAHGETILILTPVKDASGCIDSYCRQLRSLTYPHKLISIGFLESDSVDSGFAEIQLQLPFLRKEFRNIGLWKQDFGYRLPPGIHRGAGEIQTERRAILARSRNHLLFRALDDEAWVLWLDVDVIDYPIDIIERLLATGKDIVQPNCVLEHGGPSYDRNAWRNAGQLCLDDLRCEGDFAELDAVGGTMLLVRADLHRDGLIFPPFPYGLPNSKVQNGRGYPETEGLGLMAHDMGYKCWGMPNLEIRHRKW
jgi:hypothetical protein